MSLQAFKQTRNVTINFGLGNLQPLALHEAVVAFVEKFESAFANGEAVPTFAGTQVRIQSGEDKGYSVSPTVTWNQGTGEWTFDLGDSGDGTPKRAEKIAMDTSGSAPIDFFKGLLQYSYNLIEKFKLGQNPVFPNGTDVRINGQVKGQSYSVELELTPNSDIGFDLTADAVTVISE